MIANALRALELGDVPLERGPAVAPLGQHVRRGGGGSGVLRCLGVAVVGSVCGRLAAGLAASAA